MQTTHKTRGAPSSCGPPDNCTLTENYWSDYL